MIRSIKSHWESFLVDVIPSDASDVQVTETRRAFMAGALCMFSSVVEASETLPEDEACQRLQVYNQEFEQWGAEDLKAGRA